MSIIAKIRSLADPLTNSTNIGGAANIRRDIGRLFFLIMVIATGFTMTARAQSYYYVDCSGANPSDFPTISSALAVAGPNSYVVVTGTCNENVNISNAWNLNLGAAYGQTANIDGGVTVTGSNSVFLYGLNVINPTGDGFNITSSHNVTLWTVTANRNQGRGLVLGMSDVIVQGPGSFDHNGAGGINMSANSVLNLDNWGGSVQISRNTGAGVWLTEGSVFQTIGSTVINNNVSPPGAVTPTGFAVQAFGASKVQFGTCFGPNQIANNQNGGINAQENSEVSFWNCGTSHVSSITANGPVGISAGLGTQVSLIDNAKISGHTESGVELYGNSQLQISMANLISNNGSAGDPRSAGIVVDGNSEAYLRGGTISTNEGPGVLALVNSSVDSVGASFSGNSAGDVTCDSSAYLVSDLLSTHGNPPIGISCRTPNSLGNRHDHGSFAPSAPDVKAQKTKAAEYQKLTSPK